MSGGISRSDENAAEVRNCGASEAWELDPWLTLEISTIETNPCRVAGMERGSIKMTFELGLLPTLRPISM